MSDSSVIHRPIGLEVWVVLDGQRQLARMKAAGPMWLEVLVDGLPPRASRVPFFVVLRGAAGGIVDGLSDLEHVERSGEQVTLRLRLVHLTTSGSNAVLDRFAREVLGARKRSTPPPCTDDKRLIRDLHRARSGGRQGAQARGAVGEVMVDKPATLVVRGQPLSAEVVRTSGSGRRLVVRCRGPVLSVWERCRVEIDLGVGGEPRPVQLVGMVTGSGATTTPGYSEVVVRLARWSEVSDHHAWRRWVAHRHRIEASRTQRPMGPLEVTRTLPPRGVSGPPT